MVRLFRGRYVLIVVNHSYLKKDVCTAATVVTASAADNFDFITLLVIRDCLKPDWFGSLLFFATP